MDKEKERFLVTLRCSDLRLSISISAEKVEDELFSQFENYLDQREFVLKQLGKPLGVTVQLLVIYFNVGLSDLKFEQVFKPGEVFKAKVS